MRYLTPWRVDKEKIITLKFPCGEGTMICDYKNADHNLIAEMEIKRKCASCFCFHCSFNTSAKPSNS